MKSINALFVLLVTFWPGIGNALDLSAYQRPDGAITVHPHGDHVDPYFAMKALRAARELGDPAKQETKAWIDWLLVRQKADGGFARYCESKTGWQSCDEPDADDSLLAMWVELLHEAAPRTMPPNWAISAQRAEHALDLLRDRQSGVYYPGAKLHDALLMDNVEVFAALRRVGELRGNAGDAAGRKRYSAKATALQQAMSPVFQANEKHMLRWSSGDNSCKMFYPYAVGHLYPWLHRMDTNGLGRMLNWPDWLDRYGEQWLTRAGDNFSWGLVALLAYREQSYAAVRRWLDNADALRGGENWNVLDEALLQGLARARLEQAWK